MSGFKKIEKSNKTNRTKKNLEAAENTQQIGNRLFYNQKTSGEA